MKSNQGEESLTPSFSLLLRDLYSDLVLILVHLLSGGSVSEGFRSSAVSLYTPFKAINTRSLRAILVD